MSSPWKVFPNRHYHEGIYLLNRRWHDCSTVTGIILQKSLARLFNSYWQDYSTVAGMIVQQSLAQLFNSHWHNQTSTLWTEARIRQLFRSLYIRNNSIIIYKRVGYGCKIVRRFYEMKLKNYLKARSVRQVAPILWNKIRRRFHIPSDFYLPYQWTFTIWITYWLLRYIQRKRSRD